MIFAKDSQGLLSLHQSEEVICDSLTIEEVVDTEQKIPGNRCTLLLDRNHHPSTEKS